MKPEIDVKQAEIQGLKAELKELKALVTAVVTRPDQAMLENVEITPFNASPHSEPGPDSELKALKKQMKRLQTKFTQKVTERETAAAVSTVEASNMTPVPPVAHQGLQRRISVTVVGRVGIMQESVKTLKTRPRLSRD